MFKCEFCNTEFKNVSALNFHKKSARYCLKIQNNEAQISTKDFICEFCNAKLKTKRNLDYHKINCKQKNIDDAAKDIIKNIEEKHQEENKLLNDKINELNLTISDFNNNNELIKKDLEIAELKGMLKSNKENYNHSSEYRFHDEYMKK